MAIDNLKIQEQLNSALKEMQKLLEKQTKEYSDQLKIVQKLKEAFEETSLNEDSINESKRFKDALSESSEESERQLDITEKLAKSIQEGYRKGGKGLRSYIQDVKRAAKEHSVFKAAMVGFVSGLESSFIALRSSFSSFMGVLTTGVSTVWEMGKAVASIPIKIFNQLVDLANSFHGGTELRQAFEDLRKQFGDFKTGISHDVIKSARSMKGQLESTGLSSYRIFGLLYEKLNFVREVMTQMGPIAHQFSEEMSRNAEVVFQFQKGLGISNESMAALALKANKQMTTMADIQRQVANQSLQMGKRFGLDQKLIGRDISEMMSDFKNFGSVGIKQMSSLSVFARKLGADFKELLGVVDQFDNFEDAAENAAKLAQSFGLNVDAFAMMQAQDPGERIDMLRKSFFQAGKSIEGMTRQERALLEQTTGLTGKALEATFANKNQALSYDKITEASGDAEKAQLTQAEALKMLSNSIERLVKSGQRQGGFWERFLLGFRRGVFWSKDFFMTLRNIRRSLWESEKAGWRTGKAFMKLFPGVQSLAKGFREFFDPKKFRELGKGVSNAMTSFFKDLKDPTRAKNAVKNLLDTFKNLFKNMVSNEKSAGFKILSGFKDMFATMGKIALQGFKIVLEKSAEFMKGLAKAIRHPEGFIKGLKQLFNEMSSTGHSLLSDVIDEIVGTLGESASAFADAGMDLAMAIWEQFKKHTKAKWDEMTNGEGVWGLIKNIGGFLVSTDAGNAIALFMFGPAFLKGATNALGSTLVKLVTSPQALMGAATKLVPNLLKFAAFGLKTGGALAAAGGIGYAIGSAISWALNKAFDFDNVIMKLNKVHNETQKSIQETSMGNVAAMGQQWSKQVENQELANLLISKEADSVKKIGELLKSNNNLRLEDQLVGLRAVTFEFEKQQREISARIALEKNFELGRGGQLKNQKDQLELDKLVNQELAKQGKNIFEIEGARKKIQELESQKSRKDMAEAVAPKKQEPMKMGLEDLEDVDKLKKISAKEMTDLKEKFENVIKPALIGTDGKSGIKGSIVSILESFKDVDVGKFDFINQLFSGIGMVPEAISKIGGLDINAESVKKTIIGIEDVFSQIAPHVEKYADQKSIENLPILKGVTNVVKAVNEIYSSLNDLEPINAEVKLKKLGKVLGLSGEKQFSIDHGKLSINVNVNVTMDAKQVAVAVRDTGEVAAGPKSMK